MTGMVSERRSERVGVDDFDLSGKIQFETRDLPLSVYQPLSIPRMNPYVY